jgi:hypothetical protein
MRELAVIAPAVAMAVAACGGGGSTGTDQSTATSTPTSKVSVEITAPQHGASVKRRVLVRGLASPEDASGSRRGASAAGGADDRRAEKRLGHAEDAAVAC